jgi:ubiquinone/menaquinone biosynthesis C-methylase UbiE
MNDEWASRLTEMEDWYRDLLRQGDTNAEQALMADYAPHAEYLGRLRGRVLDVGGGAGLAARYLHPDCEYWVIDPAEVWEEAGWQVFGNNFRSGRAARFVRGSGEALPFEDNSFDAALAFWSMNHAAQPDRCIKEMARILKTAGSALVVLEDMEPSWLDVARFAARRLRARLGRNRAMTSLPWGQQSTRSLRTTLRHKLPSRQWPLQEDHIRITEQALLSWAQRRLRVYRRLWRGGFLTYEMIKEQ